MRRTGEHEKQKSHGDEPKRRQREEDINEFKMN